MVSVTIPTHHQVDNGIVSLTNPNHHQWHHLFAISNHHQRHRLCDTPFQPIISGIVFFDDNAKQFNSQPDLRSCVSWAIRRASYNITHPTLCSVAVHIVKQMMRA